MVVQYLDIPEYFGLWPIQIAYLLAVLSVLGENTNSCSYATCSGEKHLLPSTELYQFFQMCFSSNSNQI